MVTARPTVSELRKAAHEMIDLLSTVEPMSMVEKRTGREILKREAHLAIDALADRLEAVEQLHKLEHQENFDLRRRLEEAERENAQLSDQAFEANKDACEAIRRAEKGERDRMAAEYDSGLLSTEMHEADRALAEVKTRAEKAEREVESARLHAMEHSDCEMCRRAALREGK